VVPLRVVHAGLERGEVATAAELDDIAAIAVVVGDAHERHVFQAPVEMQE
jgi:hypothetical protein